MRFGTSLVALAAMALVSANAFAEDVMPTAGTVAATTGPEDAVLVLRGSETYSLAQGDALFPGDTVFTRTNGSVTLTLNGCVVELDKASSLDIDSEACLVSPTQLASNDVVGGYKIGADGGIGATPILAGLGLAAAGGAAAGGGGGSSQSTSP